METDETLKGTPMDFSHLTLDDVKELSGRFPGVVKWVRDRAYMRQLSHYRSKDPATMGEHEKQWLDELEKYAQRYPEANPVNQNG